jgi:hypothetical protein
MQETCVTVTLMKFFYRVYLLTGDTKYVDAFEISFFNAYLGAVNTEKVVEPTTLTDHPDWIAEPLPFDSYSPLTAGTRGRKIGGLKVMSDMHYYGCCACIGSAGIGIVPKLQLCESDGVIAMNLFINGTVKAFTPAGKPFDIITDTEYPRKGDVRISLKLTDRERFKLAFRIPSWSKNTVLKVNGACENANSGEYAIIDRQWSDGDLIELCLDMRTEAIYPISYGSQVLMNEIVWEADHMIPTFDREDPIAKNHIALRRGPLMLAQENRLGYSVDDPIDILVNEDGSVSTIAFDKKTPYPCIIALEVPTDKGNMLLTDYASAGKLWTDESKMAVWMLTK